MSTPNPDEISGKIAELQNLQSQVRLWRSVSVVVIIATVVICVAMISKGFTQLAEEGPAQDKFLKELQAGLNSDVVPAVKRIAGVTMGDMMPIAQKELEKLNQRAPEIADAARKELMLLSKNIPNKAEKALQRTFGDMLRQRESQLRKTFPDATDAKVALFVNNLVTVADERLDSLANTLFAEHILALNQITDNLHRIYTLEEPNIQQEVPNWEMALLFFDVIREEIRPLETATQPK